MNDIRFAIGTRVRNQDLPPGSEHTGTLTGEVVGHDGPWNVVRWEGAGDWVTDELGTDLTIVDDECSPQCSLRSSPDEPCGTHVHGTERVWDERTGAWTMFVRPAEAD